MSPDLGAVFAAAMHDYPAFRFIHQHLSGAEYRNAMRLTFEYYIALERIDGELVLGCWDDDELVGGMLVRRPEANDLYDPGHPVTIEFISNIGQEAWDRLDAFELMMEKNAAQDYGGCFEIVLLGAKPDSQGKGYGRFMLEHVSNLARNHPTTSLIGLSTESPEKISFYEHFGYQQKSTSSIGPVTSTSFLLRVE